MWFVALVLGFAFPGFGQALAGRWRLGLGLAIGVMGLHALTVVSPWLLALLVLARLGPAIHGAVLVRGSKIGARWEEAFAVVGVCAGAMLVLRIYVVETFQASSSSMAPTLQVHDRFIVDKLPHAIERGDVIAFHYPCSPKTIYAKRVVALAGDSVEVRCDVVYVNGKAVPHERAGKCEYLDLAAETGEWRRAQCELAHEELGGHHYRVYDSPYRRDPDGDPRDFPLSHGQPSCANTPDRDGESWFADRDQVIGLRVDGSVCAPQMQYVVPDHAVFVLGDNRHNSNDSRVWGPVPEEAVIGTVTGLWWPDPNNGSRIGRIE